jgi:NAD+ kinase
MKIALFATSFSEELESYYMELLGKLNYFNFDITIHEPIYKILSEKHLIGDKTTSFRDNSDIKNNVDFLFSIGGDGTFLKTVTLVKDSGIPILGFNTGRLGFLSSISIDEISDAIENILGGKYQIEKRSLIKIDSPPNLFGSDNYALNEITVHKRDSSSMIMIHAYINDVFLNTYWADGLIVSTPTGSTAYSLSCGGPILTPDSNNFIITPIAIHNLTVRPIVVPDNVCIKLRIEGRIDQYLVTLDSNNVVTSSSIELSIRKESFYINIVQQNHQSFFSTIREKLMWGWDKRN